MELGMKQSERWSRFGVWLLCNDGFYATLRNHGGTETRRRHGDVSENKALDAVLELRDVEGEEESDTPSSMAAPMICSVSLS